MRPSGLLGILPRLLVVTTRRGDASLPAPKLVERGFEAKGPSRHRVADITDRSSLALLADQPLPRYSGGS
jgi:hypothetical protein